jgi:LacI family transcriptional regulator
VGLVIEDLANPFYSAVAQAVENVARPRGYMLITGSCEEDPERERELILALLRRRVDALLLVPAGTERDQSWLARELGDETPVVFVDRPPHGIDADAVLVDNAGGAQAAVAHLAAHGHRRIACVADVPKKLYTAAERVAGYEAALDAAGLLRDPELLKLGAREADEAQAAVNELLALPDPPTAIFCGNNRVTVGALRALHGREDVALVGFDDFELADLLGTTVVRHEAQRIGAEAAELAFRRLDGLDGPPRRVVLPTQLIARGSGERTP